MKFSHAASAAAVIAMLASAALPALAQAPQAPADQDHSTHHPDADQKTAPPAAAAPATPARPGMGMGGMGGMGMMQGGPGQMPMTGHMGQMMGGDMHRMMEMMHGRGMMMDGGVRHLEGRLAFLKTELQITSAQENAWASFAEAMRKATATKPAAAQDGRTATLPETLPERLDSRLVTLQAKKAAIDTLYTQLDDRQKSLADDLIERIGLV